MGGDREAALGCDLPGGEVGVLRERRAARRTEVERHEMAAAHGELRSGEKEDAALLALTLDRFPVGVSVIGQDDEIERPAGRHLDDLVGRVAAVGELGMDVVNAHRFIRWTRRGRDGRSGRPEADHRHPEP